VFYSEQRFLGGLAMALGSKAFLDISGGYAFDRFFWEGPTFHDNGRGRLDIGDSPFVGLNLHIRY
jgi:hypothetical protein